MNLDPHFYGRGPVYLAEIDADTGAVGLPVWVGDVDTFDLNPTSDTVSHKESHSGQNGETDNFPVGSALGVSLKFYQFSPERLAMLMRGQVSSTDTGTVSAESLPTDLVAGDNVYLVNPFVSSVVVTDSAAEPATLAVDTNYTIDLDAGRLEIVDVGTFTQPFKVAYSFAARKEVGFLTTGQKKYQLTYEGKNLAEGNAMSIVTLYKLSPGLIQKLSLITSGTDVAGWDVNGGALMDLSKSATGALGQFGKIATKTPS